MSADRWITQTENNCVQAATASILGLALGDVPNFIKRGPEWELDFRDWLEARGWEAHYWPGNYAPDGLYLAAGPTVRGTHHMVVMRDGKVHHDPHPSRAGLVSIDRVWVLAPLDPASPDHTDPEKQNG